MSSDLDQITAFAMRLSLRERIRLVQRLVSTIDDEIDVDSTELWFEEAERRLKELRSGEAQGIDSDAAFTTAREALER